MTDRYQEAFHFPVVVEGGAAEEQRPIGPEGLVDEAEQSDRLLSVVDRVG